MPTIMGSLFYRCCRAGSRFIRWQTINEVVLDAHQAARTDGFILACSHLSHLEPILVSGVVNRHVRWMARIEFYRKRWAAASLNWGGAFPVDRFGNSLASVRTAVRLAKAGECVGIFPEGGVRQGPNSIMRGGPIKLGVCTIALQAGVPVVPVIVLGTEKLNHVGPWLPFRRGKLWYAFGNLVPPGPRGTSRRADRAAMGERLRAEFSRLYQHTLARTGLSNDQIP